MTTQQGLDTQLTKWDRCGGISIPMILYWEILLVVDQPNKPFVRTKSPEKEIISFLHELTCGWKWSWRRRRCQKISRHGDLSYAHKWQRTLNIITLLFGVHLQLMILSQENPIKIKSHWRLGNRAYVQLKSTWWFRFVEFSQMWFGHRFLMGYSRE